MPTPLLIDGSLGEGGGQILRTSLSLSIITQTPFTLSPIRPNRDRPGLQRQHLTAVRAAAQISNAQLEGDALLSTSLTFRPGHLRPGSYSIDIGSAGSTSLVLQTILPPLLLAPSPSSIELIGGTHNPGAPPYPYLEQTFLPLLNRMGPKVNATLHRAGFYPNGGGRIAIIVTPAKKLSPLHITTRGHITHRSCTCVIGRIPDNVAERELARVAHAFPDWPPTSFQSDRVPEDQGPGNLLYTTVASDHLTETFSSVGSRGIRAESVADDVIAQTHDYLASPAPVGPYLADQLLLPLALAGSGSYLTTSLTRHCTTNIHTIQSFLPQVRITTAEVAPSQILVEVRT
jgi:RNA 3'-terminal phosphate cyclase (ATP)